MKLKVNKDIYLKITEINLGRIANTRHEWTIEPCEPNNGVLRTGTILEDYGAFRDCYQFHSTDNEADPEMDIVAINRFLKESVLKVVI